MFLHSLSYLSFCSRRSVSQSLRVVHILRLGSLEAAAPRPRSFFAHSARSCRFMDTRFPRCFGGDALIACTRATWQSNVKVQARTSNQSNPRRRNRVMTSFRYRGTRAFSNARPFTQSQRSMIPFSSCFLQLYRWARWKVHDDSSRLVV